MPMSTTYGLAMDARSDSLSLPDTTAAFEGVWGNTELYILQVEKSFL